MGTSKQAYIHTHTHVKCSIARVGCVQARPNYFIYSSVRESYQSTMCIRTTPRHDVQCSPSTTILALIYGMVKNNYVSDHSALIRMC